MMIYQTQHLSAPIHNQQTLSFGIKSEPKFNSISTPLHSIIAGELNSISQPKVVIEPQQIKPPEKKSGCN